MLSPCARILRKHRSVASSKLASKQTSCSEFLKRSKLGVDSCQTGNYLVCVTLALTSLTTFVIRCLELGRHNSVVSLLCGFCLL